MSRLDDRSKDLFGLEEGGESLNVLREVRSRARNLIEGPISRLEPMHLGSPMAYRDLLHDLILALQQEEKEVAKLCAQARTIAAAP